MGEMVILANPTATEPAADFHPQSSGWIAAVLWLTCGAVVVYALFSVPRKALELLEQPATSANLVSGLIAAASVWLCWRYAALLARRLHDGAEVLTRISRVQWLALVIGAGILIRVAWVWYFPTVQTSDHATYVTLAKKLLAGEPYFDGADYANWPPGLPFFLAANFLVLGVKPWVITFANLLLYALASLAVYRLAYVIAGEGTARVATLLLLIWPNDIMCTGLAKKELLILPLLTWAIVAYIAARRAANPGRSFWLMAITGALLGAASLTQPSLMLFPLALVCYEFARGTAARKLVFRAAVVILAMGTVILPWSIRNYLVLDAVVPISTAGGEGFYSANNERATGKHIPVYQRSLDPFDEVTRSTTGFRWGLEWISGHPLEFLQLTVARQVQVLGEDSDGAYWGVKIGGKRGGPVYLLAKGVANGYWMIVMFLILAMVLVHWRRRAALSPDVLLVMLSLFYVVAIDSVFQAGSRHHMPLMGALSVLAALIAFRPRDETVRSP